MVALLDGKTLERVEVRSEYHDSGRIRLNDAGMLAWQDGRPAWLTGHDWRECEEPNPHTAGTLTWALHESKAGKYVRRASPLAKHRAHGYQFYGSSVLSVADALATDWEVVSATQREEPTHPRMAEHAGRGERR
jgi:hypothetical protein